MGSVHGVEELDMTERLTQHKRLVTCTGVHRQCLITCSRSQMNFLFMFKDQGISHVLPNRKSWT